MVRMYGRYFTGALIQKAIEHFLDSFNPSTVCSFPKQCESGG